jgi:hypothetical protein
MILLRRSFLGTTATGEIFRLLGCRHLISSHNMIVEKPASTWYFMSSWTRATFSGSRALRCGPQATAASMASQFQPGPQSIGTPCDPHRPSVV